MSFSYPVPYTPAAEVPPPAPSDDDSSGSVVDVPLEDPGNTWEASTAVVEGYRIAETVQGELRVFEAVDAGTTGDLSGFTDLTIDLTPLGLTSDDDFDWRYLGIVGQVSWELAPLRSEFGVDADGPYVAGHEPISEAAFTFRVLAALGDSGSGWEAETEVEGGARIAVAVEGAQRVFEVGTPGETGVSEPDWGLAAIGQTTADGAVNWTYRGIVGSPDFERPVLIVNSAGDADWFLDENNGSGWRFNNAIDGEAAGGKSTQMTVDGFKVSVGAAMFEVNYDPFSIIVNGLPTSDPAIEGQLWRSGNDVKISTGV